MKMRPKLEPGEFMMSPQVYKELCSAALYRKISRVFILSVLSLVTRGRRTWGILSAPTVPENVT